jgi:outer membrane autotransporter protein
LKQPVPELPCLTTGVQSIFQTPAYAETTTVGSPLYALSYASKSQSDITHDLGVQFDSQWQPDEGDAFHLNAQAGWVHQYAGALSDQASFSSFAGTGFTVYGTRGPTDAARVSVGGETSLADALSLSVRLQTLVAATAQIYSGNATLA